MSLCPAGESGGCVRTTSCQHVKCCWIDQSRCVPLPSPCQRRAQHRINTAALLLTIEIELQDALSSHRLRQPQHTIGRRSRAQPALQTQDPSPSCATKPVDLVQDDTGLTGFEIANLPASRTVTPPLSVPSCSPRVLTSRKTSNISPQPQSTHTIPCQPVSSCCFLLLAPVIISPLCQLIVIFEDQC